MTLKARLLTAMALVAVLLVVAAVTVTRTTTSYLLDQVDDQLLGFSDPDPDGRGPRGEPGHGPRGDELQPGEGDPDYTTLYLGAFVGEAEEIVTLMAPRTGGGEVPVPELDAGTAERLADHARPATVDSTVAGVRYRIVARHDAHSAEILVFGLPLDGVDATIDRLVLVELLTSGGILVVLALTTWWVMRLGVRPVRRMTQAASTIAAGDLAQRIPDAPSGTEAAELGTALNVMLERIEHSFAEQTASEDRLRRFVADASHELRTPITTIRGYAELFRIGGLSDPSKLAAAMGRTEAESVRMGGLVEDMLTLARLDRGTPQSTEVVRLDAVVSEAVADAEVVFAADPLTTHLEPVTVEGLRDQLFGVVANLLTNAAVHSPPGTPVEVSVTARGGMARLVVSDEGPGMDPETIAHAFERFYRADPSRSRASGGSGLGLSIVAAIVAAHGGAVRIATPGSEEHVGERGTTVIVELPLVPA